MKLHLPKMLFAAVMACMASVCSVTVASTTVQNILPALPAAGTNLTRLGPQSSLTCNGVPTADNVATAIGKAPALMDGGWFYFVSNGQNPGNDASALAVDSFKFLGRQMYGGEAVTTSVSVGSILPEGKDAVLTSITISFDDAVASNNQFFSVWSWDGSTATKLTSATLSGTSTGNSYTMDGLSLSASDKILVVWANSSGAGNNTISKLSSSAVYGILTAVTWNGGATGTWVAGSDTWLDSDGTDTTFVNGSATTFSTEGAQIDIEGAIRTKSLNVTASTTFSLVDGASLTVVEGLNVAGGATMTVRGGLASLTPASTSGTGKLDIAMANTPDSTGNNILAFGDGCTFESVRISSGTIATNLNWKECGSNLGAAKLIMAGGTTYVIRNGNGTDGSITTGDILLEGAMDLQVYGSTHDSVVSNNIAKASDDVTATIRKTDGGTTTLTGKVTLDSMFVANGTLVLGDGNVTTVRQVRLSESGADGKGANGNKLRIDEGAALVITGNDIVQEESDYYHVGDILHSNDTSLMLGHWGQNGILEVNGGTLTGENSVARMSWTGTGTMNINSGSVKLLGINFWAQNAEDFRGTLNLGTAEDGDGVLEIGAKGIADVNTEATLNLGNGTIRAMADTSILHNGWYNAGHVNLLGTKGGTVFDTNGHDFSISMGMEGDGNLVKTGEGNLTTKGVSTTGTIKVEEGTWTLDGVVTVSKTIINNGTIAAGMGYIEITALDDFDNNAVYSDALTPGSGNGYLTSADFVIIKAEKDHTSTVEGVTQVRMGDMLLDLVSTETQSVISVTGTGDSGAYYVNTGVVDYGADDNSAYSDATTALVVNGGDLTLSKALKDNIPQIQIQKDTTLTINEGVTLGKGQIAGDGAVTLVGDGMFQNGTATALPTGVTIGSDWTGTVVVDGIRFAGDDGKLSNLANANSFVGLTNCTGWLTPGGTVSGNLNLLKGEALSLTDGSSGRTQTFSGKIKGEGDFVVDMGEKDVATKANEPVTYTFSGNVSEWTGTFRTTENKTRYFGLNFTGSGDMGAGINNAKGITLNTTIGGSGDRAINGTIANAGILNLTVNGGGNKTFTKDVTVTQLTVENGTAATFNGTTAIGAFKVGDTTTTNTGNMSITGAVAETIATTNMQVAVAESTLLKADGTTPSEDGNGFMTSGYYYVVKSVDGGKLTIAEDLIPDKFKLADGSLLYEAAGSDGVYYINNSITFQGSDAANVASGKTIQVMDGADLKLTDSSITAGIVFKTAGSGTITLDVKAVKSVSELENLFKNSGTAIGTLVLEEGSELQLTSSNNQPGWLGNVGTVEVKAGASFSHRVTNNTYGNVDFVISGEGLASDPETKRGALVLGDASGTNTYGISGKVSMADDATICVCANRTGLLNGELIGNDHILTKTGAGVLQLGQTISSPITGSDKMLDLGLDIKEGTVYINFSNAAFTAESRKISGKVTMADGTSIERYDGHTEFTGGLAVNGSATIMSTWAKGLTISSPVEGGDDAVLHLTRNTAGDPGTMDTVAMSANNSAGFSGTYSVEGKWTLRADNADAFTNATVKLDSADARLAFGSASNIKLAGLTGDKADAAVTGAGTLEIIGSGDYTFAGSSADVKGVTMAGTGKQTLTNAADGATLSVTNGGQLTFTDVVNPGAINLDLTGATAGADAFISIGGAVTAGKIALNLLNTEDLQHGAYNLLSWAGISVDQFEVADDLKLKVMGDTLQLVKLPSDFFWKGTDGTWAADDVAEWAGTQDGAVEFGFEPDTSVHFIGAGSTIAVTGDISVAAMETSGDWGFTTDAGTLTVGDLAVTSGATTLGAGASVTGKVTMGDATSLTVEGTLAVGDLEFTDSTISHNGTAEAVSALSGNFTATGGTVTTGDNTMRMALDGVALNHTGDGMLAIQTGGTLTSLTSAGTVFVDGTTTIGTTTVGGQATVTTGGEAFDLGSATTTVKNGSVTTGADSIKAGLDNVALTTLAKDTTITGTQTLASLTTGSNEAVLENTTIGGTTLSGSSVTTGTDAFDLGAATTKVTNGTVSTNASDISATLTGVDLTTTGAATINGTQSLTNLTAGGTLTIDGAVTAGTVHDAVTLGGTGSLSTGNALSLAGASSIGTLTASSISLADGATLKAGDLNLTSNTVAVAGLSGISCKNHLLDVTGSISQTNLVLGITVDDLKKATFGHEGNSKELVLGSVKGLTNVAFETAGADGKLLDDESKRVYTISVTDGTISVVYESSANGWIGSGDWDTGSNEEFGGGVPTGGDAAFTGEGSSTINVSGDKSVGSLIVDVDMDIADPQTEYTLKGDAVEAESVQINQGALVVENEVTATDELVVAGNGSLTISGNGSVTAGTASGEITNDGSLTIGDGSDVTLAGSGNLTVEGVDEGATAAGTTVTVADGATIGTLTNKGGLTIAAEGENGAAITSVTNSGNLNLTTATTITNLDNSGTVDAGKNKVTLAGTSTGDGELKAGSVEVQGADHSVGTLDTGSITLDSAKLSTDKALLTATTISQKTEVTVTGLDADFAKDLAAGDYTIVSTSEEQAANLDLQVSNNLTQEVAVQENKAVFVESGDKGLVLAVVDDSDRTWHTDLTHTFLDDDCTDTGKAVLDVDTLLTNSTTAYGALETVKTVVVDGGGTDTIDLSLADQSKKGENGLVINNLTGDEGSTLKLTGRTDDLVTLANSKDTSGGQALEIEGLRVQTSGESLTIGALNGKSGTISGELSISGTDGDYSGAYDNAVITMAGGSQTLAAGEGLTVKGSDGTVTLGVAEGGSTLTKIDTTGADVSFSCQTTDGANLATTRIKIADGVEMTGGTLTLWVSAQDVMNNTADGASATAITTADSGAMNLKGVTIKVVQTEAATVTQLATVSSSQMEDIELLVISSHPDTVITDGNGKINNTLDLSDAGLLTKYFTNIHLVEGSAKVYGDRQTDYYTGELSGLSANGAAGVSMAGSALSYLDPQNNQDEYQDLAKVMDSLDQFVDTKDNAAADRLGAALAGASVTTLGAAQMGDVDRQLRAIRNRVVNMGSVAENIELYDQPRMHAWITAEGDYNKLGKDGFAPGYTLSSWGGTVGFDYDFSTRFTAGMALTAMYGTLTAQGPENRASGDLDNYYVTAFARYATGAWVNTLVFTVGRADATLERTVGTIGGDYTAKGSTAGTSIGLMYEAAYTILTSEDGSSCWQPVVNVAVKHTKLDGYNEEGSDAALKVGSQSLTTVTAGIGARGQMVVGETMYNRASVLEVRALAKAEMGDLSSEAEVSLLRQGNARTGKVEGSKRGAVGLEVGAGLVVPVGVESGALFFDASAELRSKATNLNATVGYRLTF